MKGETSINKTERRRKTVLICSRKLPEKKKNQPETLFVFGILLRVLILEDAPNGVRHKTAKNEWFERNRYQFKKKNTHQGFQAR